jgi:8-oxo-dGTP diphosphatase
VRSTDAGLAVVLMQRFKIERGEYWVVPGGGVESGESPIQAAQRELLEETGLEFRLTRKLYESVNPISKRVAHYWVADFLSGSPHLLPTSPEILERHGSDNRYAPRWVRLEQVSSLPLFPGVIRQRLAQDLQAETSDCVQLEETD